MKTTTKPVEESGYSYYSKKLEKVFDSVEELKAAEAAADEAARAKEEAAAKKKAEAKVVEDAWKALNSAKREYSEAIDVADEVAEKAYHEALEVYKAKRAEIEAEYKLAKEAATTAYNAAVKAYNEALTEFNKAHPEGFHITFKDGDREITLANNTRSSVSMDFDKFYNLVFKDFWRF